MKIGHKMGAGFALLLVIALLLVALLFQVIDEAERAGELQQRLYDEMRLLDGVTLAMDRQVKEVGELLVLGEMELEEVARHREEVAELFRQWRARIGEAPDDRSRIDRLAAIEALERLFGEVNVGLDTVIASYRGMIPGEAVELFEEIVEERFEKTFRTVLRGVTARERQRVETLLERRRR